METPYLSPISAAAICRSGAAASSKSPCMAIRLEICSFISAQPNASIELFLELQIRAGHHSLAAKEHEVQPVASGNHCPHGVDSGLREFEGDCIEQCLPNAVQASACLNRERKNPTAWCRAEFPGAYLADDEAEYAPAGLGPRRFGYQERPIGPRFAGVMRKRRTPVVGLGKPGHPFIQCDDLGHVSGARPPDQDCGAIYRCASCGRLGFRV